MVPLFSATNDLYKREYSRKVLVSLLKLACKSPCLSSEGVAAAIEEATTSSQEIANSATETAKALEGIAKTAQVQAEIAEKLSSLVARFKI